MTIPRQLAPTKRKNAQQPAPPPVHDDQWAENQRAGNALREVLKARGIELAGYEREVRSPYRRLSTNFAACLRFDAGDRAAGTGCSVTLTVFRLNNEDIGRSAFAYALRPPLRGRKWEANTDRGGEGKASFRGRLPRLPDTCADEDAAARIVTGIAEFLVGFPEYWPMP